MLTNSWPAELRLHERLELRSFSHEGREEMGGQRGPGRLRQACVATRSVVNLQSTGPPISASVTGNNHERHTRHWSTLRSAVVATLQKEREEERANSGGREQHGSAAT